MGKKGLLPDSSISILLTIPEGAAYEETVRRFFENQPKTQLVFYNPQGETVTIGLVRELLSHSSFGRGAAEPQALIVCAAHTATIPAQNALLKIVEEPPAYTQIVLAVYPGKELLSTLVSRCREILWTEAAETAAPASDTQQTTEQLTAFLQHPADFSYADAIALAETLKDGEAARQMLRQTLQQHTAGKQPTFSPSTMQNILRALEALEKNGNVRLVLEHCFFTIKNQAI